MNDTTKQFLDDQFNYELATRRKKREATEDWCRAMLAKETPDSEVKPDGERDGRKNRRED